MPPTPKKAKTSLFDELEQRAAARGYTIEQDGDEWYAAIGATRWGPMASLEELDEFLPAE